MPTLVEKLGNFGWYVIGDPIIKRVSHNYVQTEVNLRERHYFEALKSAGKTLFYTAQQGIWLGMSALEIMLLYSIAHGLYPVDLKRSGAGAVGIVLFELLKDVMNNPQRYYIVRPRRNAGTTSGVVE